MKKVLKIFPVFLSFSILSLFLPSLSLAYTITESLQVQGNLNLQGSKLDLSSGQVNLGRKIEIDFNQGGSKIYEDINLHIATDDNLWLDAPGTVFVENDLNVSGSMEASSLIGTLTGNVTGNLIGNVEGNIESFGKSFFSGKTIFNGVLGLKDAALRVNNNQLTDRMIKNDITASNYLPLSGGTVAGALTVTGVTTLTGVLDLDVADASNYAVNITQTGNGGGGYILNTGTGTSFRVDDQASDTTPFIIDASGNLGIGTTSPSQALDINGNTSMTGTLTLNSDFDPSSSLYGFYQGGTTITSNYYTIKGAQVSFNPTATGVYTGETISMYYGQSSSADDTMLMGYQADLYDYASTDTYYVNPAHIEARKWGSGTLDQMIGGWFYTGLHSGLTNSVYGIRIYPSFNGTGNTVGTFYGLHVHNPSGGTGKATGKSYGIYLENITSSSATEDNFSIYSAGAINYFGGNVGIGTTSPQATLDIDGYAKLAKNSSAPVTCDADHEGSIALTSNYTLCVCNSSSWVEASDGSTACSW